MASDGSSQRARELAKLQAEDSVFEDGTAEAYRNFLSMGGTEREANQVLCDAFHGLPMMVNTLLRWADIAGCDSARLVSDAVATLLREDFQVRTADRAFDKLMKRSERIPDFLSAVRESEHWVQLMTTEPKFEKSVLVDNLKQVSGLPDEALEWVQSPDNCVKRFGSLLDDLLSKASITTTDLRKFYDDVAERATYDENTMTLTLRIIAGIRKETCDIDLKQMLRRCAQEVCTKAVSKAMKTRSLSEGEAAKFTFTIASRVEIDASNVRVPDSLLDDLWAVATVKLSLTRKTVVVIDSQAVKRIQELYSSFRPAAADSDEEVQEVSKIGDSERPAYLSTLCHPYLLRCMDKKMFVQSFRAPYAEPGNRPAFPKDERQTRDEETGCLCMLVALAYVFQVMREPGGDGCHSWGTEHGQSARKLEDLLLLCVESCEAIYPQAWGSAFKEKRKNMETHAEVLRNGIKESLVVARGIVLWVREGLLRNPRPDRLRTSVPWYLELLELVAEKYVVLRHDVLDVLVDAYGHNLWEKTDVMRNTDQEEIIRRFYGRALVSLLRLQMGTDLINVYSQKFASRGSVMEALYLREFVVDVVEQVSEPSRPFAQALLNLLAEERVIGAFQALEKKADPKLLAVKEGVGSFVKSCSRIVNIDLGVVNHVSQAYQGMKFNRSS